LRAAKKDWRDLVEGGLIADFFGGARAGSEFFGEPFFDLFGFEGGAGRSAYGWRADEVVGGEGGGAVPGDRGGCELRVVSCE
jgi:hypothetical protein